jgi:hypothetical protein
MSDEPGNVQRPRYRFGVSRRTAAVAASCTLLVLVALRTVAELAMMDEYGHDAQMGIWQMFMIGSVIFWLLSGALAVGLLTALWPRRFGSIVGLVALALWSIAICRASWRFNEGRQALADANNPGMSPARLSKLVDFAGIQAGYRLDNRLASNPNTPPEALRRLAQRGNIGTLSCLARNPLTPQDVLEQLVDLAKNPRTPDQALESLQKEVNERLQK